MCICEGAIVKTGNGREGKVVSINRELRVAIVEMEKRIVASGVEFLEFVSYGGVE